MSNFKTIFKASGLALALMLPLQGCLLPLAGLPFVGGSSERFMMGHLGSRTKVKLKTITFSAAHDANKNSATHIHLVLVYDPHMIAELLKMPAQTYFKNKYYQQLHRDHKSTLHMYSYQVPPGSKIGPIRVSTEGTPVAGFIFADYQTPGDHRIRISEERHMMVMLDKADWHVMPNEGED